MLCKKDSKSNLDGRILSWQPNNVLKTETSRLTAQGHHSWQQQFWELLSVEGEICKKTHRQKKKSDSKQQQLTDTLETHCVTEEFESTRGCKQSCDFFCFESWIWNGFCSHQRGRLNKQHIKLCRWITKCYYRETSGNMCCLCPWKTKDVVSEQDSTKITSSPSSL